MTRLLAGRNLALGPEGLAEHLGRLGPLPAGGASLIELLVRSGLSGRGGAAYPAGLKWRSVAAQSNGTAVVIVNGAEGEPRSFKDRLLMTTRPHLILDGALLAAQAVRAREVVIYIGEGHGASKDAMARALAERTGEERRLVRTVVAPGRYVAGASSAAVHMVDAGIATPTTNPPSAHERGVGGAPTLVHNVETLAQVALIARSGSPTGTLLVTVAGGVSRPGVLEIPAQTTVAEAVELAGGASEPPHAVLLGGYFGTWIKAANAWELPLDHDLLRARGLSLGCGVIGVLPGSRCIVCEVAAIMRYLASESSAQCGPCFFGLRALADACTRIAERGSDPVDLQRLNRWSANVTGRGACHHPDGAVMFLQSALTVFPDDFAGHRPHLLKTA
jgi:NADH:ubiquinone oxidoreductase subunit F (NADH-binding)